MEKKLEIIRRMVQNGYKLMNHTEEEMANTYTVEDLENFEKHHAEWTKRRNEMRVNK